MSRRFVATVQARTQIFLIDDWWRENRTGSPDLFMDELAEAVASLRELPAMGKPHLNDQVPGVRRVRLEGSRKHLYYVYTDESVTVLAVWNSTGDSEPNLAADTE